MRSLGVIWAVVLAWLVVPQVAVAGSASSQATLEVGQKETVRNLVFAGPARKADRKVQVWAYKFVVDPPNAATFAFIETHLDGSTKVTPAADGEGKQTPYGQIFAGQLDLRITRRIADTSVPVKMMIYLYTRNEDESDFPKK